MHVAVQVEFKADRKEPLGGLIRRVAALFESSGVQPEIRASFSEGPGGLRTTSAIDRALKKYPHLAHLERTDAPKLLAAVPIRRLSNVDSPTTFPLADVLALADGVPRSLPFHAVHVNFGHPDFGEIVFPAGLSPTPGIAVDDGWWINGRIRSVTAFYAVEGEAKAKKLPEPPPAIAAILAGLGTPKNRAQFVAPQATALSPAGTAEPSAPAVPREIALVTPILVGYKSGMKALVERIGLPHDLPPASEAIRTSLGASGPLKPTLVEAFTPRGYDCRGGGGMFTLRRRTATNHIVQLELDVGTWSRSVTVMFSVHGPGFNVTLMPPVAVRAGAGQYPIGDTENWQRIVANIAAIVDELDRTFVAEIEAAVDPAPEWFEPGR
jgi:hypothetical protein